jgi:hypothetical protein
MNRKLGIIAAGVLASMAMAGAANAQVCSYDWRPAGGSDVRHLMTTVRVARPSTVNFEYFGGWSEIIIYDLAQSQILYRGPPIPSYNAADGIIILAYRYTGGSVLRIRTDWNGRPNGCS